MMMLRRMRSPRSASRPNFPRRLRSLQILYLLFFSLHLLILLNGETREENPLRDILRIVIHLLMIFFRDRLDVLRLSDRFEVVVPLAGCVVQVELGFPIGLANMRSSTKTVQVLVLIVDHSLHFSIALVRLHISQSLFFSSEPLRTAHEFFLAVVERLEGRDIDRLVQVIKIVNSVPAHALVSHGGRVAGLDVGGVQHVVVGAEAIRLGFTYALS